MKKLGLTILTVLALSINISYAVTVYNMTDDVITVQAGGAGQENVVKKFLATAVSYITNSPEEIAAGNNSNLGGRRKINAMTISYNGDSINHKVNIYVEADHYTCTVDGLIFECKIGKPDVFNRVYRDITKKLGRLFNSS